MTTMASCTECSSVISPPIMGFGSGSDSLRKIFADFVSEFKKAETFRREDPVLLALDAVFRECSKEGWDGEDAIPIGEEAYWAARRFIMALPVTSLIPMPEVVPEPGGAVAFEWFKGKRQVFVVSFSRSDEVEYAGLFGTNRTYGTEYFGNALPSVIAENLKKLYR
jgi:hypothetical protein